MCSLLSRAAALPSWRKRWTTSVAGLGLGEEELDREALAQREVLGRDDDAHPADAEHALHLVLTAQDVADVDG